MLYLHSVRTISDFPELIKHKPPGVFLPAYWWNLNEEGTDKRIKVLIQAIMETY